MEPILRRRPEPLGVRPSPRSAPSWRRLDRAGRRQMTAPRAASTISPRWSSARTAGARRQASSGSRRHACPCASPASSATRSPTQLFLPIAAVPFLVVVAQGRDAPGPGDAARLHHQRKTGRRLRSRRLAPSGDRDRAGNRSSSHWGARQAPGDDCDETGFPGGALVEIEIGEGGGDLRDDAGPIGGGAEVGVDTGGTFTDFVCRIPGRPELRLKVCSTPADPSQAIIGGIEHIERANGA